MRRSSSSMSARPTLRAPARTAWESSDRAVGAVSDIHVRVCGFSRLSAGRAIYRRGPLRCPRYAAIEKSFRIAIHFCSSTDHELKWTSDRVQELSSNEPYRCLARVDGRADDSHGSRAVGAIDSRKPENQESSPSSLASARPLSRLCTRVCRHHEVIVKG